MPKRELYFFALYRLLIATVIAALLFSPLAGMVGEPYHPVMAAAVSGTYLACALLLLLLGRSGRALRSIVLLGVGVDIVAATLLAHALPGASAGISMSLLFNIAAAATLLPLTLGMSLALGASVATVAEYVWKLLEGGAPTRTLAELAMFATSYLALAYISFQVANRARQNQQLANQRGDEVANLFQINELIIRRMRTGVLVVDGNNRITLANEAASTLLGDDEGTTGERPQRGRLPAELARRLQRWRGGWNQEETPLELSPDHPEVQPRFARLLAGSDLTLVFLDDSSVVSRRAESLTLSAMGRFSASLAHEIRNPLAAINYAVQLLEEEDANFNASDRRLLEIIRLQCHRTNGIVESVLGLARRERANPENVDLVAFVRRFVLEYRQGLSLETDSVEPIISSTSVAAQVDPRHLHQMLTALVHNALKYGRIGEQPARVRLRVALQERSPVIDVMDRGPGIPEPVVAQLFRPFFTTSEHGTGLGLYIARELCRANQARLDYVPVPAGGACFRLTLAAPHTLLSG